MVKKDIIKLLKRMDIVGVDMMDVFYHMKYCKYEDMKDEMNRIMNEHGSRDGITSDTYLAVFDFYSEISVSYSAYRDIMIASDEFMHGDGSTEFTRVCDGQEYTTVSLLREIRKVIPTFDIPNDEASMAEFIWFKLLLCTMECDYNFTYNTTFDSLDDWKKHLANTWFDIIVLTDSGITDIDAVKYQNYLYYLNNGEVEVIDIEKMSKDTSARMKICMLENIDDEWVVNDMSHYRKMYLYI